jgi:voltage-gated potassium channel
MYRKFKHKVHILLHPELGNTRWDKIINAFIIILIVANVVAVMLETVKEIDDKYKTVFDAFDQVSVYIFTLEYLLRVWSCTADPRYKHSIKGRLRYMLTPGAIIDLLAFLPFYIHRILYHVLGISLDFRVLRILRLMRFFRLFRLTAYTRSAQMILNVFKNRMRELVLSFVLTIFLIIIASCIMYFVEHQYPTPKTTKFTSIPETLWWAVVSLTTTGYGDMYPLTPLGKFLGGVIMLTGVAFFALPAGIITAGFLEEMRIIRKGKSYKCPHCGGDITSFVHHHHMEGEQ